MAPATAAPDAVIVVVAASNAAVIVVDMAICNGYVWEAFHQWL